ncbi:MAG: hypothetical protein QOI55_3144 [Actinomycetota bacterium]|nr:hypothetical protein [Actinomycetota bacterium]
MSSIVTNVDDRARPGPAVIAIVGAGPRGTGVLERLLANLAVQPLSRPVVIHVIDPHPPGPGRVWRREQSSLLWLNSTAEDVTLFPDHTVTCEGPILRGPSLFEWAHASGRDADPLSFPTRHEGSDYLDFVFREVVSRVPDGVSIEVHADTAIALRTAEDGDAQLLFLASEQSPLRADAVVLTLGHLDARPSGDAAFTADFARRHGLAYLPPAYGGDVDLSAFEAEMDVVVRGFGLAFVDLLVLLTEGRGGRFDARPDDTLVYHPSGREPRLHVGSRRGVPYRCKPTYRLRGPRLQLPRFFAADAVAELLERHDRVDFLHDVWPRLAKEIAWAYYQELFAAHPHATRLPWSVFERRFARLDYGTPELDALVDEAVIDPDDRLDFAALDRPLAGLHFAAHQEFRDHLRAHVRRDIDRRSNPRFSADLGAFYGFLSLFEQLPRVLGSRKLGARSRIDGFDNWWFGFFSYFASGPPPRRLEELLALIDAGIVEPIGADMWVEADETAGRFRAGSPTTPDVVEALALIDARLPAPSVEHTEDALLRELAERGEVRELILRDDDGSPLPTGQLLVTPTDMRLVDRAGTPHPRRFAAGPHTTSRAPAFARPCTDAPVFRHNDALARAVVTLIAQRAADLVAVEKGH